MNTNAPPLDATRCPLCGGDNRCAMEIERETGEKQGPCWCVSVDFTPALLAQAQAKVVGTTIFFAEPQLDPGLVYVNRLLALEKQARDQIEIAVAAEPVVEGEVAADPPVQAVNPLDAFSATLPTHWLQSMSRVYGAFALAALAGIPLGLVVMALYPPLLLLGWLIGALFAARWLATHASPAQATGAVVPYGWMVVAVIALLVVGAVPVVGPLLVSVTMAAGLGACVLEWRRRLANRPGGAT